MKQPKHYPTWTLVPAYALGALAGFYGRRLVSEKVTAYRFQRLLRDCSLLTS